MPLFCFDFVCRNSRQAALARPHCLTSETDFGAEYA